jgi:hypothetical protein
MISTIFQLQVFYCGVCSLEKRDICVERLLYHHPAFTIHSENKVVSKIDLLLSILSCGLFAIWLSLSNVIILASSLNKRFKMLAPFLSALWCARHPLMEVTGASWTFVARVPEESPCW